jgi:hypothetical protein
MNQARAALDGVMLSFWIVQVGFWGLRRMLIWPSCFRRLEMDRLPTAHVKLFIIVFDQGEYTNLIVIPRKPNFKIASIMLGLNNYFESTRFRISLLSGETT